ncbi:cation channel sperm-associated protein 1 isoform X8 [Equus przewalskii]|uniref:Cation channel sperm-associated protein 1 isoform X8 n=1 Tax=Equus przewalskii TaxID=9798 RepID=A0ABM4K0B3_EQUPR
MAGKAHNEADISDLDMLSRPSSSTPHHRPGHSGGHNLHESHPHSVSHHHADHHRRPLHHGEAYSHHSYVEPYHDDIPGYISEHHRGHHDEHHHKEHHHGEHHHGEHHHGHHGEHQHREHHHGAHPHDYLQGDHHYGVHHHGGSEVFGPHKSYSMARASLDSTHSYASARQPSIGHIQNLMRSRSMIHIPGAQVSSKVHPQDSSSKSSESWAEEDEQFQKRKAGRTQRPHKKLHTLYLCYWLWEKLSYFIQDLRRMLRNLIESLAFEAFIFLVVCLNTIMLVVQTFAEVEIRGDFFIMVMAVLDFMLMQLNYLSSRTFYHQSFRIFKVFKSLRALRAIRVLRRLSFLTSLQEVTGTLARSLPSITAILILMFTCLFLFSVVLRALFRQSDPKRFQNIFTTIFTLFTLLTLDDWSLIYLDSRAQGAWHIIPILMIYIIIQYFIFLNLVIAVLVDNFQMALLRGLEKVKQERAAWIHEKLLDDSLTELRKAEPVEEMSEHTKQKQLMEKKFGTMTEKQQEVLFHFLQLVAGVEHYQQKFRSQASVIDEIVDTTFEAGEEDFRK